MRRLAIAKVRLVGHVTWLGTRHGETLGKTVFGVEVEISDVVLGNVVKGNRYFVYFGDRYKARRHVYPSTLRMLALDYFIVAYRDEDNDLVLVGRPPGQDEYEKWDNEHREYQRQRGQPGFRDPRN